MDITIQFARPSKKGVVQNYSEAVGLSKEPPLKYFGDQVFDPGWKLRKCSGGGN